MALIKIRSEPDIAFFRGRAARAVVKVPLFCRHPDIFLRLHLDDIFFGAARGQALSPEFDHGIAPPIGRFLFVVLSPEIDRRGGQLQETVLERAERPGPGRSGAGGELQVSPDRDEDMSVRVVEKLEGDVAGIFRNDVDEPHLFRIALLGKREFLLETDSPGDGFRQPVEGVRLAVGQDVGVIEKIGHKIGHVRIDVFLFFFFLFLAAQQLSSAHGPVLLALELAFLDFLFGVDILPFCLEEEESLSRGRRAGRHIFLKT
ncbi:MAG: hypothetical protein FJY81_04845 [Candidatus Aminicenantes bacterium]|nr:hypothetical protein [Candidatus Aminicenantes bacterium]